MRPPRATRKVVTNRSSATKRVPKAKPARAARAKPKQLASLPKSTASVRSGSIRRIEFPPGSAKLSNKAALGLKNVAAALSNDTGLRIQLLAYAGRTNDSASQSRRLSLSRALAARSKLIDQGVRSTRIDVRALGNKSAGGPADRIDIIVTKR
jgi:outer membrane protein OmpA-like peptidoglycan-associated protein